MTFCMEVQGAHTHTTDLVCGVCIMFDVSVVLAL